MRNLLDWSVGLIVDCDEQKERIKKLKQNEISMQKDVCVGRESGKEASPFIISCAHESFLLLLLMMSLMEMR